MFQEKPLKSVVVILLHFQIILTLKSLIIITDYKIEFIINNELHVVHLITRDTLKYYTLCKCNVTQTKHETT